MPRRKPLSGKQKKEQQQIKRAIKRGDLPPPDTTKKLPRKPRSVRPIGQRNSDAVIASARKLQSSFIKLPPKFLEETKAIASTVPLQRPISYAAALHHDFATDGLGLSLDIPSCPRRPKWRFDMSKKEVEHNEEGFFKKWLAHTDQLFENWQKLREPNSPEAEDQYKQSLPVPPSPTYFERNLEVWRQLWRVTEISQIILVLLDSRCPLLHYPPTLAEFLSDRKVILVLTKADITGPVRVAAWIKYFNAHYPDLRVVQVESYVEKEATTVHQGGKQYEPHLPETFRNQLVNIINEVHAEMLNPPKRVSENSEWLNNWVPPVKREIDWNRVLNSGGVHGGDVVGGAVAPKPELEGEKEAARDHQEPDILTIGLVGQPNVGKSSLLNALFGVRRVRASKTPGKTKHFQTLYWTPDVRLVDCPGLVFPSYVPMEMQVLSGTLPISKISAIPACINHAAKLLPLERVYKLDHPSSSEPIVEDKRTWREGMKLPEQKSIRWTAMDILVSYANAKNWVTAKAGRPDIHRAGNAILRALAEGRIGWGLWPSDTSLELVALESAEADAGIWIPGCDAEDRENSGQSEEETETGEKGVSGETTADEENDHEEDDYEEDLFTGAGRFGALQISDGENDEEDEGYEGEGEGPT